MAKVLRLRKQQRRLTERRNEMIKRGLRSLDDLDEAEEREREEREKADEISRQRQLPTPTVLHWLRRSGWKGTTFPIFLLPVPSILLVSIKEP